MIFEKYYTFYKLELNFYILDLCVCYLKKLERITSFKKFSVSFLDILYFYEKGSTLYS